VCVTVRRIVSIHFISLASWRAAISRAAIHVSGVMNEPRCFFWIASRNAARAVAMTRAGVESERLVDCSHSLYPFVMASGGKPRGHPYFGRDERAALFFWIASRNASRAVAMTRGGVKMPCTSSQ
jgi:hypothetical protein